MSLVDNRHIVEATGGMATEELDDTQPALIFIPDISGFTRFVNEAGIKQSRNLITNLLEIIIEANILDMKVCEIQGDAILFYKIGEPPTVSQIVEQCKQFYLDFQNYLRVVERDTGSDLSHVLTDSKLTLKTIVHYGNISVTQIKDYTKLMGKDVIVAHRLLKNTIDSSEYVLLTDGYLNTQDEEDIKESFEWTQLKSGTESYEYIGDVNYKYAYLTPLRLLVTDLNPLNHHEYPNTFSVNERIHVPAKFIQRIISNFRLKPQWIVGMQNMEFDTAKAGRDNVYYKAELENSQVEIQTVQSFKGPGYIEYVEKFSNLRMFPNVLLFYYLKEVNNETTDVTIEFHYSRVKVSSYLHDFFARKRMKRLLCRSILKLKVLSEKYYKNRKE